MSRFGEMLRNGWRGVQNQAGIVLAGAALFLLAFLVGLHLFFPTAAVQQWLRGEIALRTQVDVQLAKMSLRPVFTLSGRDIVATYGNRPLTIDELRLKPLWSSLVTGDPGIAVDAALLQGRLDVALRRSGSVALHADGLKLTEFPVHPETGTLLSGTIVKADLLGRFPMRKGSETRLSLEMDNCSLTVLGQPVPLGRMTIAGNGQGNTLQLTTLSANGGAIAISGTGTMFVGNSAASSRISLDLTLRPTRSAPPTLTGLLDLAARKEADNSYRLKLNGSPNRLAVESQAPSRGATTSQEEEYED